MAVSIELSKEPLELTPDRPLHFIGIGGIGMSGLAKLLLESGLRVSGSDVKESAITQQLQALGATIHLGHQAEHVPTGASVVVSTAIDVKNPEIQKALADQLGIYHRSDLLREILQGKALGHETTVGVTGTHGKTTITGMTGMALRAAGLDPTIIAGGNIPALGTNAVLGKDRRMAVAELDESDGTLIQYTPSLSVISNLELDHADHYADGLASIIQLFQQYLAALKPGSQVFFNMACPTTKALAEAAPSHIKPILLAPGDVFTGQEPYPTYWLKNARVWRRGCYQSYIYKKSRMLGELTLEVPGRHNLFNALAAIAMGDQLGADFEPMAQALREFTGMGRRFEKVGECQGALLVDDYAHHPTEVQVTLQAARESLQGGPGRIVAVFQPHRYTRLQALWEEFQTCFQQADRVYITDVYAASETPLPGIDAESFCRSIQEKQLHSDIRYLPKAEWTSLRDTLQPELKPQDILLSLGAGDITQLLRNWEKPS